MIWGSNFGIALSLFYVLKTKDQGPRNHFRTCSVFHLIFVTASVEVYSDTKVSEILIREVRVTENDIIIINFFFVSEYWKKCLLSYLNVVTSIEKL